MKKKIEASLESKKPKVEKLHISFESMAVDLNITSNSKCRSLFCLLHNDLQTDGHKECAVCFRRQSFGRTDWVALTIKLINLRTSV